MSEPGVKNDNLESLRETHEDLHSGLQRLCSIVQTSCDNQQLIEVLDRVRKNLAAHFELEEADGNLNEAVAHTPVLMRQASDLLEEHATMLQRIDDLIAATQQAPTSSAWWDDARLRVDRFVTSLLAHESAEQQLIRDAFNADA